METTKYIVKISYITFTFTDRLEALDFAETAFRATDEDSRSVKIEIVREKEKKEDEEEEDE